MFTVILYINNSPDNKITKNLTQVEELTGTLREECSIIDPVIKIEYTGINLTNVNYLYIPTWGRYYYINDVISIRTGIAELRCHVDVLMSHKKEILESVGIVERQQSRNNLLLNDGSLKVYQNPIVATQPFPSGFPDENWSYVLGISGS